MAYSRCLSVGLGILMCLISIGSLRAAEPMRYVYPPPEGANDRRLDYYWDLLRAALEVTKVSHGPYEMVADKEMMNAARILIQLSRKNDLSVAMLNGSNERELILLPVRIPLDRGLTGYRLFLIRSDSQHALDGVKTLADLRIFTMGQGDKWIDTQILRHSGFILETSPTYDNLFKMLAVKRFDLFPRGINEIRGEYLTHKSTMPNLAIERNLMIYYPQPRYFYFRRDETGEKLANRVEAGLRILVRNGEFERRYQVFKKTQLDGIQLAGRKVFRLENPLLSAETPLNRPEYWDTLSQELKGGR